MRILPQMDEVSDQPGLSPSLRKELDVRGAQQFLEKHPEFYASDLNGDLLIGFIESHSGVYSLRNLEIAYYSLLEDGAFEERPQEPAAPAQTLVQRITRIWPADTRPKSATSLVLDPKTAEAQTKAVEERKARVVEQRNVEVPSMSAEDARNLAPLPASGEDRRFKTAKEIKKDRTKMDLSELREAARRELEAIVKRGGHTAYTKEQLSGSQE